MNGSRSYSSRHGAGDASLEALNRTIEGLEARIEGMMARGGHNPDPVHSTGATDVYETRMAKTGIAETGLAGTGMIEGIRARQRALQNVKSGPANRAALADGSQSSGRNHMPSMATATKPDHKGSHTSSPDIGPALVKQMSALRNEMTALRNEARSQELPDDLRRDLAGISASIDALGAQDPSTDSLRLELDSMRTMIDRLAREDSVRALETRWQTMEDQVSALDVGGLREELVNLAYRVDDIRAVLDTRPESGQARALENKITDLSASIEAMSQQPAAADPELPRQIGQLGVRLDEITQAIAAMPATMTPPVDNAPFERLEARLASVARKIDDLEPTKAETQIGSRIEHLATRVAQLADEDAVSRLDARIERLQGLVEDGARNGGMPELSNHLADISGKIEALDARGINQSLLSRLDTLAAQMETLSTAPQQPAVVPEAVIGRLEALIGRAEQTPSFNVDPLPGLETLDARLSDIAASLQKAEVTAAGHAMQPTDAFENVEARLAEISDRIDRSMDATATPIPGIENLEARLADIANRLDMSSASPTGPGDEALRGLEDQIANLSQLISSSPQTQVSEVFDERFASIEEHLATSDEFIVEAARQAAEAALSAYSGQTGAAQSPQEVANIEVIAALADDLKALESLSRNSDDRTVRAFEAVQDTLLKIADRLEHLDATPGAVRSAGLADMREAVSEARTSAEAAVQPPQPAVADQAEVGLARDAQPVQSPSRVAADVFAASDDRGQAEDEAQSPAEKSFFSGLAARIRPGGQQPPAVTEPQFAQSDTPPLDPAMELDPATANMPLEPGSGAPDINRILKKVREAQAAERENGVLADNRTDKADYLASARRAAMAAAAEVETISNKDKTGGSGGLLSVVTSRRRPLLMVAGAVLLAVMSFPLITGLIMGNGHDTTTIKSAVTEPAAPLELPAPASVSIPDDDMELTDGTEQGLPGVSAAAPDDTAELQLPEVRVVEPEETLSVATSLEGTAAISPSADNMEVTSAPTVENSALVAELEALPDGVVTASLKAAAISSSPLAFYEIGARFTEGRGVAIDLAQAARWYQRAADLGHAPSQYRIANFYEKGSGLERDLTAAKKWYQMAAEQGNASAMHNLAVLYATAGPAPDFGNAAQWFGRAAEVGVRDSQVNLAILYARGDGISRDLAQSYKWFAIAANDGDKDAAVKRDEVFNALRPEQAEAARAAVAAWAAQPISSEANATDIPDAWRVENTETAAVDMSKAVRNIQAILNNNGFDSGQPDGVMGKRTVAAIKAFQSSIGVEPTGEIDDLLVKELLDRNS